MLGQLIIHVESACTQGPTAALRWQCGLLSPYNNWQLDNDNVSHHARVALQEDMLRHDK